MWFPSNNRMIVTIASKASAIDEGKIYSYQIATHHKSQAIYTNHCMYSIVRICSGSGLNRNCREEHCYEIHPLYPKNYMTSVLPCMLSTVVYKPQDDVIIRHCFPHCCPFVRGTHWLSMYSSDKKLCGPLMFPLLFVWTSYWTNIRNTDDLSRAEAQVTPLQSIYPRTS